MLGKIQSGINSLGITQPEQPQVEKAPISSEQAQTQSTSSTVQEAKLANARMKESAFSGSLQKAMLDAALINASKTEETPAPVGTKAPDIGESAKTGKALKLHDTGPEVEGLQHDLNRWRKENNLPEIQVTGVFTEETEQAVKDFQRATSLKDDGVFDEVTNKRLYLERKESFKQLDPDVKLRINNAYSALQNDPAGRDNLLSLVEDRQFSYLISPDAQQAAIDGLMQNPGNLDSIKSMTLDAAILEKDKNFQKLPDEIKRQTMNTMFYKAASDGVAFGERFCEQTVDASSVFSFFEPSVGQLDNRLPQLNDQMNSLQERRQVLTTQIADSNSKRVEVQKTLESVKEAIDSDQPIPDSAIAQLSSLGILGMIGGLPALPIIGAIAGMFGMSLAYKQKARQAKAELELEMGKRDLQAEESKSELEDINGEIQLIEEKIKREKERLEREAMPAKEQTIGTDAIMQEPVWQEFLPDQNVVQNEDNRFSSTENPILSSMLSPIFQKKLDES